MRRVIVATLVWWFGAVGLATVAQAQPMVAPGDVVAVAVHDWNGDYRDDRAVLVNNDGNLDLYLTLSSDNGMSRPVVAIGKGVGWTGEMAGTKPEMTVTERGSLKVRSANEAIGRHKWNETLTIAFRKGRFMVAGFTHLAFDTMNLDDLFDCDVNLLNGKGIFNGSPFVSAVRAVPVEQWFFGPEQVCPKAP